MITTITALLPYQEQAVEKLKGLKVGALYMEQGTGKTRTALEIVKERLNKGKCDVILWLCPCSVKQNLKEDIIKHFGEFPDNILVKGIESISSSDKLTVLLYELVQTHTVMLIVDESNLVKNPGALRSRRIQQIAEKCKYRMILNGTPVSRTEADLFEQWYILDPRILGYKSYWSFAANHLEFYTVTLPDGREVTTDRVRRVLNKEYLTQKIAPYTYQITKKEANLDIPVKMQRSVYFSMTYEQWDEYHDTRERFLEEVEDWKSETVYRFFTALQHVTSGRRIVSETSERMRTEPIFDNVADNPRIQALMRTVHNYIGGEKCIIFAKYKSEIEDISETLDAEGLTWTLFTGDVSQKKRQENRAAFAGGVQFLLANKSCGAYGLNLQFCHNVIFYDNDFDFATRSQAEDRVHRLGQTKDVMIYDIVANDTIDEFIRSNLGDKDSMVTSFKALIKKWKDAREKDLRKAGLEDVEDTEDKEKKRPA